MYGLTRATTTLIAAAAAGLLIWLATQIDDGHLGGERCLDAPDLRLELDRKVQPYGEVAGRQADRPLEPLAPLLLADRVGVLDGGAFAGIERKAAVLVRDGFGARKKTIAYGPFLALGGIVVLLLGGR